MSTELRPLVLHNDGTVSVEYTEEELAFFQRWQSVTVTTGKDEEESRRAGKAIKAAIKQCWFNARKVILRLAEYAEASYVEGWAVSQAGFFIEHGWVVKGTTIIDPTLPEGYSIYFPGLEFQGRKGIDEFLATSMGKNYRKEPFFFAFGWGGMNSPSFRKCYEDAMAYVAEHFSNGAN